MENFFERWLLISPRCYIIFEKDQVNFDSGMFRRIFIAGVRINGEKGDLGISADQVEAAARCDNGFRRNLLVLVPEG
jgi:hypothetical protein